MAEEANDTKTPKWPYTSFKTVHNWIQRLAESKAVPPRIDRSILPGSEGQKTQVLAALKFLGLVADNGDVTPLLVELVEQEKERPRIVRELLAKHYPTATTLAAINATTKQLEETFDGLGGDTLRKAMTFYLHAAKFSGHPLSKNFKAQTGFSRSKRKSATGNGGSGGIAPPPAAPPAAPVADAKSRYLDMLLTKASATDTLDAELLNRIEKLLGYPASDGDASTEAK